MDTTLFHGLWTGALLLIFIGIVVWAWSSKRKRDFDEAANIPFDDDAPGEGGGTNSEERR